MCNPTNRPSCCCRIINAIREFFCVLWHWICRLFYRCCPCSNCNYDILHDSIPVKAHVLVVGETFNFHKTFIQKLNLQIELCSAESSNVILVFCPVVSRIGTDMEAAMDSVTDNKPVILVFMHHCHDPSHMTNITVQPSRSNIVQVVHCTYHETKGLLECKENEQAVAEVHSKLLRYKFRNKLSTEYVDSHVEVPQPKVPPTQSEMEQQPMDTPDANRSDITDGSKLQKKGPKPVFGKSVQGTVASGVKVHMLVTGETFQTHETFMQKLKPKINPCSAESSNVILIFCPVVSRIGTDMEAAMDRVTENKPVILVFMHHCHDPSHMTNITVQPSRRNIVQVVHCAFYENKGLLECQENKEAVDKVLSALLSRNLHAEVPQSKVLLTTSDKERQPMAAQDANEPDIASDSEVHGKGTKPADLIILDEDLPPEVLQPNVDHISVNMEEKPTAAQDGKRSHVTNDSELPGKGTDPAGGESESYQKMKMIVLAMEHSTGSSGELPTEVPQSDFVCIDMDKKQQPISTQDTDSLNITNDSELPGKGTDPAGEKSESDQKMIVSPVEHSTGPTAELPAELPQSDVCIDMDLKQQPISTQNTDSPNITNDNSIPGQGTDPVGEKSESDQKTILSPVEHSTRSLGGLAPEVLQSNVDHTSVDMEEKPMAAHDGKGPNITNDCELPGKNTDPTGEESESDQKMIVSPMDHSTGSSAVKAHLLVTGETFNTHETFMEKLKLQIELCSAESSNVILVFCPVVSQIGTDMEAAMARVTGNQPVILVFMHHCHNPSHMTDITVQPSRSNIVQVVHCAYHETKGLLECKENEQAVADVYSTLKKY